MRKEQLFNNDWNFTYFDGSVTPLNLPHTWNNKDGQDGGNDYKRGTCTYEKKFAMPAFAENECFFPAIPAHN